MRKGKYMKNVVLSLVSLLMFVGCGCGDGEDDDTCNSIVGFSDSLGDTFGDHSDDYNDECTEDDENFSYWSVDYQWNELGDSTIMCYGDWWTPDE